MVRYLCVQVCNLVWSKSGNELVSTHGYSQNQIIVWRFVLTFWCQISFFFQVNIHKDYDVFCEKKVDFFQILISKIERGFYKISYKCEY